MPIVRVEMFSGRSPEQKAELANAITAVLVRIAKTSADATTVIFSDIDKGNWADAGELASGS